MRWGWLVGLLLVAGVARAEKLPAWGPNPELLAQLAPEENVQLFRLRPPKGYRGQAVANAAVRGYGWEGPARRDGSQSMLVVMFAPLPRGIRVSNPTALLRKATKGIALKVLAKQRGVNFGDLEVGSIDGVPFGCVWFQMPGPRGTGATGFVYMTPKGREMVVVTSFDLDAYAKSTLPLAEASAMTLKLP